MKKLFIFVVIIISSIPALAITSPGQLEKNGVHEMKDSIIRPSLMNDTLIIPYVYKVNKYEIIPPYGMVDTINTLIKKILINPQYKLCDVNIWGSASPEGPWQGNVFLGKQRAEALANFFYKNAGLTPEHVTIKGLAEEWQGTVDSLMTHPNFPYRDSILSIIKNVPNLEQRKAKIKMIENGRIWSRLIAEIFPPLRNTRVIINYYQYVSSFISPPNNLIDLRYSPALVCPPSVEIPNFPPRDRFYSVKTNALFLAALCANIGFEMELFPKTSIDIPFWYSPYDIKRPDRKIRLLGIQPEFRYWLGEKAGDGLYLGMHGHVFGFNIALNDHARYQDPNRALWGGGIGTGYACSFGNKKHFYLDCGIGVGYANIVYDKYRNYASGPDVSPKFESGIKKDYWGITRLNISVGYKWLKPRKTAKK